MADWPIRKTKDNNMQLKAIIHSLSVSLLFLAGTFTSGCEAYREAPEQPGAIEGAVDEDTIRLYIDNSGNYERFHPATGILEQVSDTGVVLASEVASEKDAAYFLMLQEKIALSQGVDAQINNSSDIVPWFVNECSGGGATCKCDGGCVADSGGCMCDKEVQ